MKSVRTTIGLVASVLATMSIAACGSSDSGGSGVVTAPTTAPTDGVDAQAPAQPNEAKFADAKFEACVRAALGQADGPVMSTTMEGLTALSCVDAQLTSIAGLELATNLTDLALFENAIVDLAPLAKLTKLVSLGLGKNAITDVTPLAGLTALEKLDLAINQLSDIAPLKGLAALRWLHLDHNALDDAALETLASLTKLSWLTAEYNRFSATGNVKKTVTTGDVYASVAVGETPVAKGGAPARALRGGVLRVASSADGRAELRYVTATGAHPVRAEYDGVLELRGGVLHHVAKGGDVVVGEVKAGRAMLCEGAHADACEVHLGLKTDGRHPGFAAEPVVSLSLRTVGAATPPEGRYFVREGEIAASLNALDKFVLASPNQFDAGSCLFMSNTGAMEILVNQHTKETITPNGPTDLSERFFMNAADLVPAKTSPYATTDALYAFNALGGALLNRDYPFMMDYVITDANGNHTRAKQGDTGAELSCWPNWDNELPTDWKTRLMPTPKAERTLIFVEPTRSKNAVWSVALMTDETIDRIKYELRTRNAPVIVVYNHYLYWHANIIIGYDDNADAGDCPMVRDSIAYYKTKNSAAYATKIESWMASQGGCKTKGVFYVRDSIYDGTTADPVYTYRDGVKEHYSKRVIKHEYDWVKYLANHSYTFHRQ